MPGSKTKHASLLRLPPRLQADALEHALLAALPLGPQGDAGGVSLPDFFTGELQVTLVEARALPVWGFPWQSNPYCRLTLGGQAVQSRRDSETSHASRHRAPAWNQEFTFLVEDPRVQVRKGYIFGQGTWSVRAHPPLPPPQTHTQCLAAGAGDCGPRLAHHGQDGGGQGGLPPGPPAERGGAQGLAARGDRRHRHVACEGWRGEERGGEGRGCRALGQGVQVAPAPRRCLASGA